MTEMVFDAVIVGSGPGGGAAAWSLTQKGYKVLILEAGPRYDPATDYQLETRLWEQGFPHKHGGQGKYIYAEMQSMDRKYEHLRSWNHIKGHLNNSNYRISNGYHHARGVGGTTLHFTGEAHRLNQHAMQMRSEYGVAADWPLNYSDLAPFYSQAEQFVGVAGPAHVPGRPRSDDYPYPPHPLSYSTRILEEGFRKNDMGLLPNSLAVLPEPRGNRLDCNYCACCLKGCPRSDKGSVDVTYIRHSEATGLCTIKPNSVATHIETRQDDRVRGVHYVDQLGEHFVESPLLIIAAGAIETPRLLLLSENARSPEGLANESGQVGRNFMETLFWTSNALHPERLGSHRGVPVDGICWDYNNPGTLQETVGGFRFAPSVAESDLLGPVNYAQRVVDGWGDSHKQAMRDVFGRVLSVTGITECLPNISSYVDLAPEHTDDHGLPLARIHSYLDDMAIKRINFMASKCRDILKGCGVERIFEEFGAYDHFSSTHVFGTCRMGTDPEDSVVDEWCRSHRWENLYVTDASIFPSSGGGEAPSLTIQALALRAMSRL